VHQQNLVRRRVSWFCVNALRRNVGTITGFDDSCQREREPFDFENDDLHDGRFKINQLVPLKELFDCHVVEDSLAPQDLRAFEIQAVHIDVSRLFACDLIGMDELWRVALEALNDGVASRACELMLALSRHLPAKFMEDFLSRIFEELSTSYPLSKLPPISPIALRRLAGKQATYNAALSSDSDAAGIPLDGMLTGPATAATLATPAEHTSLLIDGQGQGRKKGVRASHRKGEEGKGGRKALRFSRALSLLQCLVDAHVLNCGDAALLPHRCCVRGAPLKLTLKLHKGSNKNHNASRNQQVLCLLALLVQEYKH
jgi:hypothetical protein